MNEPEFIVAQRAFAAHIRDPERFPAPSDVEERRLQVYRDLFFNNVRNFIRQGFPVLHALLPEARWNRLVRDFFRDHASQSPYFVEIPREFVEYLAEEFEPEEGDPPFLLELAHYEWMELVLDVSREEIPGSGFLPEGDLVQGSPLLSPLVAVLAYDFPVHRISADFQPQSPLDEPVWLLVYRDSIDEVRFMEINAVTARLLTLIQEDGLRTGRDILVQIADELPGLDRDQVLVFGAETLETLRGRGIILGTRLEAV